MAVVRRRLPVVVALAVVVGSLLPGGGGSPPVPLWDELLHVVGYAAVAGTLAVALDGPERRHAVVAFAVAVALGGALELLQGLTATRTADPTDAVSNAVGAALGVGLIAAVRRIRHTT